MGLEAQLKQQYDQDEEARAEREYYHKFDELMNANREKYLKELDKHPLTIAIQESLAEYYDEMVEHNYYDMALYKYREEFEFAQSMVEHLQSLLKEAFKL